MSAGLLKFFCGLAVLVTILASVSIFLSESIVDSNSRIVSHDEPQESKGPGSRIALYRLKTRTKSLRKEASVLERNRKVEKEQKQSSKSQITGRISDRGKMTRAPAIEHVQKQAESPPKLDYCRQKLKLDFLDRNESEKLYRTNRLHSFLLGCENAVCHFIDGKKRSPVCLKSFPGSGNTWLRGLLEKASGICTGSIYYDRFLVNQGFVGEHISNGAVSVYKAHGTNIAPQTNSLVYLIRNPFDALIAEWKRRNTERNHTGIIAESNFGTDSEWDTFVRMGALSWSRITRAIISNFSQEDRTLLIVRFEDLKTDKAKVVKRVLDFVGITISQADIEARLQDDFSTFKRSHSEEDFGHYTVTQKENVKKAIVRVIAVVKEHFSSDYLNLTEYLK